MRSFSNGDAHWRHRSIAGRTAADCPAYGDMRPTILSPSNDIAHMRIDENGTDRHLSIPACFGMRAPRRPKVSAHFVIVLFQSFSTPLCVYRQNPDVARSGRYAPCGSPPSPITGVSLLPIFYWVGVVCCHAFHDAGHRLVSMESRTCVCRARGHLCLR